MRPTQSKDLTIADILRGLGDNAAAVTSVSTLESLVDVLRTQGDQYQNLLTLLENLNSSAGVHDTHSQAVLNSIQLQMNNLKATGDRLSALQAQLGKGVAKSSPQLQAELRRQEGMLRSCLTRIADLETQFVDRKKRLQPELDESAKRRTMQTAYRQSLKTG
jgi:ABC-type transporter Mla subunit MlaD